MAALTQGEIGTIRASYSYFPGSNYLVVKEDGGADFIKLPAIDEFLRVAPFERFDGDSGAAVTATGPTWGTAADEYVSHLPTNNTNTGATGVEWYDISSTPAGPDALLSVGTTNTHSFASVLSRVLVSTSGLASADPLSGRFMSMASLMVLRELGRQLMNGDGTSNTPTGLASIYDGTFAQETQVLNASAYAGDIRAGTQDLLQLVSGSGAHGLGESANALFMTRRAADALASTLTSAESVVDYAPDALNPGRRRMHFNGVPVYYAPIREDEDSGGPSFPSGNGVTANTTSVYAAIVGGETGVRILYSGGDDENHGLTTSSGLSTAGDTYFQARGRYTLFIPERTAVARLYGVTVP